MSKSFLTNMGKTVSTNKVPINNASPFANTLYGDFNYIWSDEEEKLEHENEQCMFENFSNCFSHISKKASAGIATFKPLKYK